MNLEIVALVILGITVLIGVGILARSGSESRSAAPSSSAGTEAARTSRSSSSRTTAQKRNWLLGESESVRDKAYHVGKRTVTIGRGVGNVIQIKDENASRVHARFEGSPSGMTVTDMDSSNGTKVDDHELEPESPYQLAEGSKIEIGDTIFVYRQSGNYEDEAMTGSRDAGVSDKETQALGAVGGGDFQEELEAAVERADGDYEQAAEEVGLEPEMIENIVEG